MEWESLEVLSTWVCKLGWYLWLEFMPREKLVRKWRKRVERIWDGQLWEKMIDGSGLQLELKHWLREKRCVWVLRLWKGYEGDWQLWGFCDFSNHATTQGRSGSTIPKRVATSFSNSRFIKSLEATNNNNYLWELQCYIVWIVTTIKSWRENDTKFTEPKMPNGITNSRTHELTNPPTRSQDYV